MENDLEFLEGQVWVFGKNVDNQLGISNETLNDLPNFRAITDLTSLDNIRERKAQSWNHHFKENHVLGGATGLSHTLFIAYAKCDPLVHNREGKLKQIFSCGANNGGQLGFGSKEPSAQPKLLPKLYYNGVDCEYVACGAKHNIVIDSEGVARSWGTGRAGKLGHGEELNYYSPKVIKGLTFSSVSCGSVSSAGITTDGVLYTWGSNYTGECGANKKDHVLSLPTRINFALYPKVKFVSIAIGASHSLALTSTGVMYVTGSNLYGQLGMGLNSSTVFINFTKIDFKSVVSQISCGLHFNIIVSNDQVYSWGRFERGRLGYRTNRHQNTPKLITSLPPIVSVSCNDNSTIAITKTKRLYVWGNNKFSSLGFTPLTEQDSSKDDEDFEPSEEIPVLLHHLRGVSKVDFPGNSSGRHHIALICGTKNILHQFIRDLNIERIKYILPRLKDHRVLLEKDDEGLNAILWMSILGFFEALACVEQTFQNTEVLNVLFATSDQKKRTPLHICAENGFIKSVAKLLIYGASVLSIDSEGKTPLHYAVSNSHWEVAKLLIKHDPSLSLLVLKDFGGLSPLDYCTFEDGFSLKCCCTQYVDIFLVHSIDQKSIANIIQSILKSSYIKVAGDFRYLPDDNKIKENCDVISRSSGIIYIIGPSTVNSDCVERRYLEYARSIKANIFPVWEKIISLPAELEATIFRYQVLDLSNNREENCRNLANSIRTAITSKDLVAKSDLRDSLGQSEDLDANDDSIRELMASNSKILYILYDAEDNIYAKEIISQIENSTSILKCFDSRECSDKAIISGMARNCYAVLVLLSKHGVHSSYVRDQMNVAENNRKQIYSIYFEELELAPDFQYTLSITPSFQYHKDTVVHQLLNELQLVSVVEEKQSRYKQLLEITKKT